MMNKSISITNVSKHYGDVVALDQISCTVNEGELFGFIGPDGSGKTSLFRIMTSLLLPDSGSVIVDGSNVDQDYKELRKKVGYMPGHFSLYQDMSVEENLKFFAGVFKTTIAENYHLIEDIYKQIEPFKHRRAGKLSGGMKQKLALSCALIHKPTVLFLDEPTTGVDAVSRKEFWEMLAKLKKDGLTIIVSTPYMDEAALCDRVALMQKGRILSIDSPDHIVQNFPHQLYSIKAKDIYKLMNELKTFDSVHSSYLFGEHLHLVLKKGNQIKDLIFSLQNSGIEEIETAEISATIEDCFMELMQES